MGGTKQCCDSSNIINARLEMWTGRADLIVALPIGQLFPFLLYL